MICDYRCEHVLGNSASEVQCLLEAARMFIQAEKQSSDLLCPSYEENLTAAINCYEHAIKVNSNLAYILLSLTLRVVFSLFLYSNTV